MAELRPCPFCGHPTPSFERMGTPRQSCIVVCGNCGCRHESSDEGERSGDSWNDRASPGAAQTREGAALTVQQREVLSFLYGIGELQGCGFGDRPGGERGNYWWRKHLHAAFPEASQPVDGVQGGA